LLEWEAVERDSAGRSEGGVRQERPRQGKSQRVEWNWSRGDTWRDRREGWTGKRESMRKSQRRERPEKDGEIEKYPE
jgi:hypothetical protein